MFIKNNYFIKFYKKSTKAFFISFVLLNINILSCTNFSNDKLVNDRKKGLLKTMLTGLMTFSALGNSKSHISKYTTYEELNKGVHMNDDGNGNSIIGGYFKQNKKINSYIFPNIDNNENHIISTIGEIDAGQTVIRDSEFFRNYEDPEKKLLTLSSTITDDKIHYLLSVYDSTLNSILDNIQAKVNDSHIDAVKIVPKNDTHSYIFGNYGLGKNKHTLISTFNKLDYHNPITYDAKILKNNIGNEIKDATVSNGELFLFGTIGKDSSDILFSTFNDLGKKHYTLSNNKTNKGNSLFLDPLNSKAYGCGTYEDSKISKTSSILTAIDYSSLESTMKKIELNEDNTCNSLLADPIGNKYLGGYITINGTKKGAIMTIHPGSNSSWGVYYDSIQDSEIKQIKFAFEDDYNSINFTGSDGKLIKGTLKLSQNMEDCSMKIFKFNITNLNHDLKEININESFVKMHQYPAFITSGMLSLDNNKTCYSPITSAPSISPSYNPTLSNTTNIFPTPKSNFITFLYMQPLLTKLSLFTFSFSSFMFCCCYYWISSIKKYKPKNDINSVFIIKHTNEKIRKYLEEIIPKDNEIKNGNEDEELSTEQN